MGYGPDLSWQQDCYLAISMSASLTSAAPLYCSSMHALNTFVYQSKNQILPWQSIPCVTELHFLDCFTLTFCHAHAYGVILSLCIRHSSVLIRLV